MGLRTCTILGFLALLPSPLLFAQSSTTSRDEFQHAYASQLENSPSIFGSAPVYHIIPVENTITFAGEYQSYDVTVAPLGSDISKSRGNLDERLDFSGWSAAPYVAFSAKQFGFGFAGDVGKREAYYLRKPGAASGGGYEEHLGIANYSGVGFDVFWSPGWSFLPKFAKPTVIVGGKSINVVENSSADVLEPYSDVKMEKYQYVTYNYNTGFNVRLNLVKHFTVIPWANYSYYGFTTPKSSTGTTATDATVTDDANLFWKSNPPTTYGIDFAATLGGLDIHLGGLIGALGNLNKGSDRIQDNSHTISVSFDTKGG